MCTITFFPLAKDKFVLTTNRDEQPERQTLSPMEYIHNGSTLIYPKDLKAGGTWVAANTNGRVASLMNGGKVPHVRKESYRLSRGIVMIELLQTKNVISFLNQFSFSDIEPFTIILIEPQKQLNIHYKAYEITWDEETLHQRALPWEPQIWSSTPLYTREIHQKRIEWFSEFINTNQDITPDDLWHFHHTAGNGDKTNDLIMDRGFIHTKSITQFTNDGTIKYKYEEVS